MTNYDGEFEADVTFNEVGMHEVKAGTEVGWLDSMTIDVSLPQPTFTVLGPSSAEAGETRRYTVDTDRDWQAVGFQATHEEGGEAPDVTNYDGEFEADITFNEAGTHEVKAGNEEGYTDSMTVVVSPPPTRFTLNGPTATEEGDTERYTVDTDEEWSDVTFQATHEEGGEAPDVTNYDGEFEADVTFNEAGTHEVKAGNEEGYTDSMTVDVQRKGSLQGPTEVFVDVTETYTATEVEPVGFEASHVNGGKEPSVVFYETKPKANVTFHDPGLHQVKASDGSGNEEWTFVDADEGGAAFWLEGPSETALEATEPYDVATSDDKSGHRFELDVSSPEGGDEAVVEDEPGLARFLVTFEESGTHSLQLKVDGRNVEEEFPVDVSDSKDRLVDPVETVALANDSTRVDVGARGSTSWATDETDVLFEEFFALKDGRGNILRSTEMDVEDDGFVPAAVDEHEGEYPGIEYEATLTGDLGENEIEVTRSVLLDACRPVHDVEYDVTLLSSDAAVDVTLYQYCDYDLDVDERPAYGGDRGVYDDGIVRVEPAGEDSDGPVVGFREADGKEPDTHHVSEAPAHEVIGDGSLNEADRYPEEGSGDPVVVQAWELGSLSTMPDIQSSSPDASDSMTVRFASGDSADQLEGLLIETEPRTLHEATEVVDVDLPPTAVEIDEPVPFRVELESCVDPSLFDISASVEVSRHGDWIDEFDHDEIETEAERDDDGQVMIEGEMPEAAEFTDGPKGVGYESTIGLHVGEDQFLSIGEWEAETYVFSRVDRVAGIAAKPGDVDVDDHEDRLTGDELYTALRDRAEFINEHFASEVGSRGEIGFAIEYVTDTRKLTTVVEEGWLTLKGEREDYEEPSDSDFPSEEHSIKFMDHALEAAEEKLGVDFGAYDTALTVSHILLTDGPKFYMGDIPPQVELGFDGFTVETPTPDFITPVNARELPSGERIDAIYVTTTDGAWRHEFGHSIGPDVEFGLPDLYPGHIFAVGDIDRWGLMGHGEVITGFSRAFFGERVADASDTWMEREFETHFVDEETIEPGAPLTEKTHDDAIQVLRSPFAQFTISVDLELDDSWSNPFEDDLVDYDVELEAEAPRLGLYLIETRQSRSTGIEFPDEIDRGDIPDESENSRVIRTSPDMDDLDGVALYRFKILEDFDSLDDLKEVLDVRDTSRLEEDGFQLSYLYPADDTDEITLSDKHESYDDHTLATQFELENPPADHERISDPSVTVTREEENLFENLDDVDVPVPEVLEYELEEVDEFSAWIEEQRRGGINHGESIPPLDVMARLPDGRRTGVDPETGEIVEEIPGSRVVIRGRKPAIVTPGFEELTFEVRPDRLLSFLEDHGIETPNWIPYRQRLIVDDVDASVETVEDVPYVDGRTVTEATDVHVVDGPAAPSCVSATLDLDPDRLNVNSGGNFVTGWIGFPESVDPSNLVLESVVLDYVEVITDDRYGWVRNPPVRERGSRAYVQVKFPREEIVEQFGVGEHEPTVTGVADGTTFRGSATFEVFEPGGGRNNSGNGGGDNPGNRNGD